jgi:hypothetical protein
MKNRKLPRIPKNFRDKIWTVHIKYYQIVSASPFLFLGEGDMVINGNYFIKYELRKDNDFIFLSLNP